MEITECINILAAFCGKRDIPCLTQEALLQKYGFPQADLMVLFGGSILCGGDLLAAAMQRNIAKTYMIVGGEGHTTEGLRASIREKYPDFAVSGKSEAALFDTYIYRKYGYHADYLECRSTNCGNNITLLLELLQINEIPYHSVILVQDATMQCRMDATMRKYVPPQTTIINFATYQAKVMQENGKMRYTKEIDGMWELKRYISLLMGEIPRLKDDSGGYGPNGKGFIAHVDLPSEVERAFDTLKKAYPQLIRSADKMYAAPRPE